MDEKELAELDRRNRRFMVYLDNRKTDEWEKWIELYETLEKAKEGVSRAKRKATHYAIYDRIEGKFTHHSKDFFNGPKSRA